MNESVPFGLWVLGCLRFMYFFVSLGAVAGALHHLGSSFSGSWVLVPGLEGPPGCIQCSRTTRNSTRGLLDAASSASPQVSPSRPPVITVGQGYS